MSYEVTVRHGPRVRRDSFELLDEALAAAAAEIERVRGEGPLPRVKMLREFEPEARVAARIELSTGGWLRGRTAGVDVMGDGSIVAYAGGVRRRALELRDGESELDAVRRALSGE